MSNWESAVAVPCFRGVGELREGLAARSQFAAVDLYPRDGTIGLADVEARAARLAGVSTEELVIFTSGMAAVKAAVEVGLAAAPVHDDRQPVLAHARQLYGQTTSLLQNQIARQGVKLVSFDAGSPAAVARILERHRPDVILAETVGNAPDVPVLDVDNLRRQAADSNLDAVMLLDNTLPLSTAVPLGETVEPDERVLVVESGTKAYTLNNELSGLIYGNHEALLRQVRAYRRTTGLMPGLGSLERIRALLPASREAFDARNRRLNAATAELAVALYAAEEAGADFVVSHPSLESHDNYEYSRQHHPNGVSPLLYLQCVGEADQFAVTARFWNQPVVRQHADIGQSFGFDRTRIFPDEHARVVRIAGGAYTDIKALAPALYDAALKF